MMQYPFLTFFFKFIFIWIYWHLSNEPQFIKPAFESRLTVKPECKTRSRVLGVRSTFLFIWRNYHTFVSYTSRKSRNEIIKDNSF